MEKYRKRITDTLLEEKLNYIGGVLIVGPKGCGKTTTGKKFAKSLIEFQDEDNRDYYLHLANTTPSKLLEGAKPKLFDEWQDAPKIWGACRKSIDDEQKNGLYILTGSSSSNVKVPHTGTLRISTLKMYPMSLYESGESNGAISLLDLFDNPKKEINGRSTLDFNKLLFSICRGGWPQCLELSNDKLKLNISRDLVDQICERDISQVDNVKRNPLLTKQILKSYARNISTICEYKTIHNDVTANDKDLISERTLRDYIAALEKLFIIEDIEAWNPSIRSKTTIRSSKKRNFIDPSIATASLGLSPESLIKDFNTLGFLFESLVTRDIKIYSSKLNGQLSYYRDRYGLEADGVLHLQDGRYALLEYKLGTKELDKAANHLLKLEKLIKEHNNVEKRHPLELPTLKIIITGTNNAYKRDDGIYVIPIGCLKD